MSHKYHAIPTTVDGIRFASRKEAERYQGLTMLQLAGAISGLELQPVYQLVTADPAGRPVPIAKYVADFRYLNQTNGEVVVEDVKGMRTPVYTLKKRWTEAQFGITVTEV